MEIARSSMQKLRVPEATADLAHDPWTLRDDGGRSETPAWPFPAELVNLRLLSSQLQSQLLRTVGTRALLGIENARDTTSFLD